MNNNQNPVPNQEKEGGSFLTGFALGVFAGAAGLYLFGTEKGQKVKKKIIKEWDQAKDELIKQGKLQLEHQELSLSKTIKKFINQIVDSEPVKNKKKKRKNLISKKKKSKPPRKFKNTD